METERARLKEERERESDWEYQGVCVCVVHPPTPDVTSFRFISAAKLE